MEKITYFLFYNEKGATAVEYALIVALIAVAIIAAVLALGGGIAGIFGRITAALAGV
ncbi:MAG: Flp family type IVb pilin [Actinobacteria bacterium]|nr:Flp family type IVb pilin [Actinomycetota bacterium]